MLLIQVSKIGITKLISIVKEKLTDIIYETPSLKSVELSLEGSILVESGGTAGGDAGGEDGWDD